MTVQAAGQNSGRGCLAAASGPAEQISVVDPVSGQCLHEWVGDLGLTDELSKRLRSISSIESCNHSLSLSRPKRWPDWLQGRNQSGNSLKDSLIDCDLSCRDCDQKSNRSRGLSSRPDNSR